MLTQPILNKEPNILQTYDTKISKHLHSVNLQLVISRTFKEPFQLCQDAGRMTTCKQEEVRLIISKIDILNIDNNFIT